MLDHLTTNIVIIDDDPESVEGWYKKISESTAWRDNAIDLGDSSLAIRPEMKPVYSEPHDTIESFLERARLRVFGSGKDAAVTCPEYIPSSIFLVDWKFDLNWLNEDGQNKPSGISFCREIKRLIPHAFCALITSHESYKLTQDDNDAFDYVVEKGRLKSSEGVDSLIKVIAEHLQGHATSPTWTGLLTYSKMDKEVLHALGTSDGKNRSVTTQGFIERFGRNLFSAEASLTLSPLDSLLSPAVDGCIGHSQVMFAKSFGSRRARFGTNGTTGANSTVWASVFDQGDVVIVDKNCHISHHYSAARQGVTPLYVEPQLRVAPDVFGPVSLDSIVATLHSAKDANQLDKVKGIVLTNCTFDGYFLDSTSYVETIDKKIRSFLGDAAADRFVYFFDEAWFSFARFDPQMIQKTAMYAAQHAVTDGENGPRVYATQSVHKTLSALRQASVILEYDNYPSGPAGERGLDAPRFHQSYLAHTTTSPSAPIVASFDIARRQMLLEGSELILGSADALRTFVSSLENEDWSSVGDKLSCKPTNEERILKLDSMAQDPTKLTLFHHLSLQGAHAKKLIWEHGRVQINKYGVDSLMLMFMPGVTRSRNQNLLGKLKSALGALTPEDPDLSASVNDGNSIDKCIDQDLIVRRYPHDLLAHGRWGMREVLYGSANLKIEMMGKEDFADDKDYIICSFVTPYPPGHPVLLPGQVASGQRIKTLLSISGEVHGRDPEGRIAVAEVVDRAMN